MFRFYNPFEGIICAPYYQLFLLVIFTLVTYHLEYFIFNNMFLKSIYKKYIVAKKLLSDETKLLINKEIYKQYAQFLSENATYNLPQHIIKYIIGFLPQCDQFEQVIFWKPYQIKLNKATKCKTNIIQIVCLIYPCVRFIANILCGLIILKYYYLWHISNTHLSTWNHYKAFVISLFYHPIIKCRGFMRLLTFGYNRDYRISGFESTTWILHEKINLIVGWIDIICFAVFFGITVPFWGGSMFIYIPTSILITIPFLLFLIAHFKLIKKYFGANFIGTEQWILVGISFYTGLILIFMVWSHLIIISVVPFYDGETWIFGFKFAWLGNYCSPNDYLNIHKVYSSDIIFLIVSWFLF
eukprot:462157_1